MDQEQLSRNRAAQAEMYGEPLGELFRRIGGTLGLTQARLASIVGLSAPMLSQLMSGRRAKIGHPMVVRRVQALNELAAAAAEGRLATETLERRLEEIQAATGAALTGGTSSVVTVSEPSAQPTNGTVTRARDVVRAVQDLLRAVTSAERLLAAVRQLEPEHPELAEFLRVYGAGRTAEALAHYERLQSEL